MNREEAKSELFREETSSLECSISRSSANKTINKIYDDFESRTCESCKHLKSTGSYHLCLNPEIEDYLRVKLDFGCNKWEKKDD